MKIFLAASGMDGLLTLVIFLAITAVSTWLQRKQQKAEEESESPSPPPPPRPRRQPQPAPERAEPGTAKKPLSWEEELRRLLEGEPTAPPPPVIVPPAPKPAPPRRAAPPPLPQRAPAAAHQDSGEMDVGLPVQLRGLKQSAEAYHKASQLEQKVQAHMRRVEAQVTAHTPSPVIAKAPPAPARARTMFRSREDVRSAIIASIVLGPPKALGN